MPERKMGVRLFYIERSGRMGEMGEIGDMGDMGSKMTG
jgi:hypothetical protein